MTRRFAGGAGVLALVWASLGIGIVSTPTETADATTPAPPPEMTASLMTNGPDGPSIGPGTTIPLKELGDFSFASASRGYGLANTDQATYPVTTSDGGRTWQVDGPHLWVAAADAPATVESIGTPGSSIAFAYGGGQAIDATDDGGKQWWSVYFDNVLAAAAEGSTIWVLTNGPTPPSPNSLPPVWLYASDDGGHTWSYRSTLPGLDGMSAEIALSSADSAYALVGKTANFIATSGIVETTDGGAHWVERSDPCNINAAPRIFASQQLGATSASDLWLACGSVSGAAGSPETGQVKEVFRSTNGGNTWSSVAATQEIAYPSSSANLPIEDALAATGATHQAAFSSTSVAWLLLLAGAKNYVRDPDGEWVGRNMLERTTDGGRVWRALPSEVASQFPQRIVADGGETIVQTVDGLWSMSGGGRWMLLAGSAKQA